MKYWILLIIGMTFTFCTSMSYKKVLEELQNMPPADYSYIIQPDFKLSKESSEEKFRELYNAEELKIGASGIHTYHKETKAQLEEKYWLKYVILNSNLVNDINDKLSTKKLGKELATKILAEITNIEEYSKIEIMFMQQWNDGQVKSIKRNFFFTVPTLEETNWLKIN